VKKGGKQAGQIRPAIFTIHVEQVVILPKTHLHRQTWSQPSHGSRQVPSSQRPRLRRASPHVSPLSLFRPGAPISSNMTILHLPIPHSVRVCYDCVDSGDLTPDEIHTSEWTVPVHGPTWSVLMSMVDDIRILSICVCDMDGSNQVTSIY